MEKEILIYNPKDTPYGALSNNYKSLMVVREKDKRNVWNSVTEFIYSNLLKDKTNSSAPHYSHEHLHYLMVPYASMFLCTYLDL